MHAGRTTRALLGITTALAVLALAECAIRLTLTGYLDVKDGFRRAAEDLHRAYRGVAYGPLEVTPTLRIFGPTLRSLRETRFALPKPPRTLRVFLLGDSTAWGLIAGPPRDSNYESSFGPELQRQLGAVEAGSRRVEVINMGMCGAISEVALALLREAVTFQPDAVVVYVGINDSNLDLIEPTLVPGVARKSWLRRHLRLADLVAYALTRPRAPRLVSTRHPALKANLRQMQLLARPRGVPLLLCLPVGREGPEEPEVKQVRETVRRAGLAGTPLVDIHAAVAVAARRRGRPFGSFYSDDIHPNAEGYAVYAGAVVAVLRNLRNSR